MWVCARVGGWVGLCLHVRVCEREREKVGVTSTERWFGHARMLQWPGDMRGWLWMVLVEVEVGQGSIGKR